MRRYLLKNKIKTFFEKKGFYYIKGAEKKYFITYCLRPKKNEIIHPKSLYEGGDNIGIIIQGKLHTRNNFTVETIKYYKRVFPKCKIIVSTWEDENPTLLEGIKKTGVHIIVNELPPLELRKQGSINLQKKSSLSGIQYAFSIGCKFVLKTRTDERIYNCSSLGMFLGLLQVFPLEKKDQITAMGRIIACSTGTFENRLYNISDLMLFGHIEDLTRYFSCPEDNRDYHYFPYEGSQEEYSKKRTGEIWFTSHYLESCGNSLMWTKKDSDDLRRRFFIIVDSSSIDLLWDKYSHLEYRWRDYSDNNLLKEVTFSDWLYSYYSA